MPVTYKPTNVINSPFIRYSGTSAYNSVEFNATVFYPYLRKNSVTDTWEYDNHAFMKFIPQHKNYYDKPWGENGYYSSTVTYVKYYFEYLLHLHEKFKDAMEYRNFYILCLYMTL